MNSGKENAREILLRPYSRVLIPDHDTGTYVAFILEFPGCVAQGDTPEEAYRNLEAAAQSWIEAARDLGQAIPLPSSEESYSGRVLLRLPRSLHRRAAELARRDRVSLNQFIVAAVAERLGAAKASGEVGVHRSLARFRELRGKFHWEGNLDELRGRTPREGGKPEKP